MTATRTPARTSKSQDRKRSAGKAPKRAPAPAAGGKAAKGTAARKAGPKAGKAAKGTKGAKKGGRGHRYTAATADKYELYQKAVQSPDIDVEFLARVFKKTRGRKALHFREDFCGTGLLSAEWIRQGPEYTAEGFDIDPEPVAWGLERNFGSEHASAEDERARYTVHLKDVREPSHVKPDLRVAQNFSYCVFTTREELLDYFRAARADLAEDGLFVLDMHGGTEATEEMEEEKRCGGFTYVWDQSKYFPGTGEYSCAIHFRFPDGTRMNKAFSYSWRMWFLTELKDALTDAGFSQVDTYFEGTDDKGTGGDGVFRKDARGENCLSWIAYLVSQR